MSSARPFSHTSCKYGKCTSSEAPQKNELMSTYNWLSSMLAAVQNERKSAFLCAGFAQSGTRHGCSKTVDDLSSFATFVAIAERNFSGPVTTVSAKALLVLDIIESLFWMIVPLMRLLVIVILRRSAFSPIPVSRI